VGYCGYHAADVTRPFAERQARRPASPTTTRVGGRKARGGGRFDLCKCPRQGIIWARRRLYIIGVVREVLRISRSR